MKTPRELLLARHAAAQPRLDALRKTVLAELPAAGASVPARSWRTTLWEQLVVAGRPAWIGLAAAWTLIVVLNSASATATDQRPSVAAAQAPSPEVAALLAAQRQLFVELTAPADPPRRRATEPLSRPSGSVSRETPAHAPPARVRRSVRSIYTSFRCR